MNLESNYGAKENKVNINMSTNIIVKSGPYSSVRCKLELKKEK
jgi:hypothetical protein